MVPLPGFPLNVFAPAGLCEELVRQASAKE
jgi:hypothetical protein